MELRVVDAGGRSTLYASREGALYRKYHDTGTWDGPLPLYVDAKGVARCSGNRRLDRVVQDAFADDDDAAYRGTATVTANARVPAHLRNALACLSRRPRTIQELARACNVEVSTAWNYASRVVEHWPRAHALARPLVYAPLLAAVESLPSRDGPLRGVMQRLEEGALRGDVDWRCVDDRYAHVRLARLCVEADVAGTRHG